MLSHYPIDIPLQPCLVNDPELRQLEFLPGIPTVSNVR
jgi:hypothetical protein